MPWLVAQLDYNLYFNISRTEKYIIAMCPDALVARLTGETSLGEQISVMVDTICPQVIMLVLNMVTSLSVDHNIMILLFLFSLSF